MSGKKIEPYGWFWYHPNIMRIEVIYKDPDRDGRAHGLTATLKTAGCRLDKLHVIDVYILEGDTLPPVSRIREIFSDRVAQRCLILGTGSEERAAGLLEGWDFLAEITTKPGVADPLAATAETALAGGIEKPVKVKTARQYLFYSGGTLGAAGPGKGVSLLYNPLIQSAVTIDRKGWEAGERPPFSYPRSVEPSPLGVERIPVHAFEDDELDELSKRRLLALSFEEMDAVRGYYGDKAVRTRRAEAGLGVEATDVELEMIAQTWSEHCKHKIFQARIEYTEDGRTRVIDGLFPTYIRAVTEELSEDPDIKRRLKSVFHDNSGVVEFDEETDICFKVETHNSPSALDPYGGAITGIVGVNRDIMGTGKGAKPIFNTDVLCFGDLDIRDEEVPAGLLHPRQVLRGVHHGIIDGGNQSGIPVAAGGVLFDPSFLGKPLVFCGTGGILPARIGGEESWIKHIDPGDLAVMLGGRIGKDGIHGATFSSQALDEESPTSAVQIGDPITQKKMLDFLLEARDQGLYKGITDNGAGGLSSSLGEMAELSGGIRIDLDRCPLKYEGLAPWEILVSESQERMSLAVDPGKIDRFLALSRRMDVEAAVVGEFTSSSAVEVTYHGKTVGYLDLEFLHGGNPKMDLRAEWTPPGTNPLYFPVPEDAAGGGERSKLKRDCIALLSDPNIASKEPLVRRYDHEVQAGSVVKPFVGARSDAPSDGGVLKPRYGSMRGVTVTHGICPRLSAIDTYRMALAAVDEAMRGHVALGGDPDLAYALDNFCWPDPVESPHTPDGRYKLAQLVRACEGLKDACLAYRLPLISGKDSMKNDARLGDRIISVLPTLLISLMGIVPDVERSLTTDFKAEGDIIYLLGSTRGEMGGSSYCRATGREFGEAPLTRPREAMELYRGVFRAASRGLLSSCHDLSDGGIAVAAAESALGGRIGADIDITRVPVEPPDDRDGTADFVPEQILFCETPSRFMITVKPADRSEVETLFDDFPCVEAGRVRAAGGGLKFRRGETSLFELSIEEIEEAWKIGYY